MALPRLALLTTSVLSLGLVACASTPVGTGPEAGADGTAVQTASPGNAGPGGTDTVPEPAPIGAGASVGCRPEAAQSFVGQPGSEALAEQARIAAGAKAVRMLRPGQPATLDYSQDRLNVMLDAAGLVEKLHCG